MLRTAIVVVLMLAAFTVNGLAAEVVSAKLCMDKDYDASSRDCATGKSLEGTSISVPANSVLTLLSTIKTTTNEEIYHVWIAAGKTSGKVSVYDATAKTTKDADQADLDWLKERKIEGALAIVKLPASPSAAFRTRSQKTLGPKSAGAWTVQIYDSGTSPLKEFNFTVTAAIAPGTTN